MFCSQCGSRIEEGSSFCAYCGVRLETGSAYIVVTKKRPGLITAICILDLQAYHCISLRFSYLLQMFSHQLVHGFSPTQFSAQ